MNNSQRRRLHRRQRFTFRKSEVPLTKHGIAEIIRTKDKELEQAGCPYVVRAHIHNQAMLMLLDEHPELQQLITESYEKSGVLDTTRMLQELGA